MTDFGVNQPALVKPVDLVGDGLIRADPALKLRHMTKDHVGVSRRLENPGRVTLSALYCSFEIKRGEANRQKITAPLSLVLSFNSLVSILDR